ncbi:hypothetical protein [Streptomyces justiciae]|uniref:Uncharacterized protein n=1 Tax=Streptomyces justiciae TaxID=2780140 RepID=A0ABU3LTV1_9ACTN|nr:hypothetical protein [Streptomyces justiciae]MDT7842670.1 hypothetical protein [Streptomyces justiciae]
MELVPKSPAGRAAHSLRLSAQSLTTLAASAPDPAADARCARNIAAAAALAALTAQAAQAAQAAQTHDANNHESSQENDDRPGSLSSAAFRTALKASQAAPAAAGGSAAGRDPELNAAAEKAVEAARPAGWTRPSRPVHKTGPARR